MSDTEKQELADRRIAMHQIYWLNLAPQIEEICKDVYRKWGGPHDDDEQSDFRASAPQEENDE